MAGLAKLMANKGSGEPWSVSEPPQRDPLSLGSGMHMNLCLISSGPNPVGPLPASTGRRDYGDGDLGFTMSKCSARGSRDS